MIRRFLQLALFLLSLLVVVGFARAGECESHVVQKGEWLEKVAQKHGMSWQALWEMNKEGVKNPDLIYPDQSLCIAPLVKAGVAETVQVESVNVQVNAHVVKAESVKSLPVVRVAMAVTGFPTLWLPLPVRKSQVAVGRIMYAELPVPAASASQVTKTVITETKAPVKVYKYVNPKPVKPKVKLWVEPGRDKCSELPEKIIPRLDFTEAESESLIALVNSGVYTEIDISAGDYFTLMCSGKGRLDPTRAAWKDGRVERAKKFTVVGRDGMEKSVVIPNVCGNTARLPDKRAERISPAPVVEKTPATPESVLPVIPAAKKPCGCPELNIILSLEPMSDEEEKANRSSRPPSTAGNVEWWEHPATSFNP